MILTCSGCWSPSGLQMCHPSSHHGWPASPATAAAPAAATQAHKAHAASEQLQHSQAQSGPNLATTNPASNHGFPLPPAQGLWYHHSPSRSAALRLGMLALAGAGVAGGRAGQAGSTAGMQANCGRCSLDPTRPPPIHPTTTAVLCRQARGQCGGTTSHVRPQH